MSFTMPPRSKSPVFSISTGPEERHTLRTQIEAASAQQRCAKRRNTWREPILEETFQSPYTVSHHDHASHAQRRNTSETVTDTTSVRSCTRSGKGIGGTIKEELTTAKDLLKSSSKKQLQRFRTRATRSRPTRYSDVSRVRTPAVPDSSFVELSSDPPRAQLEDTQTSMTRTSLSWKPRSTSYQQIDNVTVTDAATGTQDHGTTVLCNKEYACDGCQQHLTGKDFYDFCSMCDPCDRVLCMTCASRGGCWRHRQETASVIIPPSLCGSPAPSYNPGEYSTVYNKQVTAASGVMSPQHPDVLNSADSTTATEEISAIVNEPPINSNVSSSSSTRRGPDDKPALAAQLQRDFLNEANRTLHREVSRSYSNRSIADREAALRDQHAALREQQISVREEALLLREREHVFRERDALFIRNLQTLALEGLARGQHIGSQFQSSKGNDYDEQPSSNGLDRSKSSSSQVSNISLETGREKHAPREALSEVVAAVEASIISTTDGDRFIRMCAEKRKKGDGASPASHASKTQQKAAENKQSSKPQTGRDHDKEIDEDDGELTPPKRQKQNQPSHGPSRRNFACPYCKHDAQRYSSRNLDEMKYRNCATHYLPNIARVKQHLQRVHWRPDNHCPRCFEVFNSAGELQEHFECIDMCARRDCPFPEKMDRDQRQQIHVKRPNTPPEALWYDIYKILFPDTPLPESPYADEENLTSPPSAVPSVTTNDEAAQMLQQVFNEGLNRNVESFDQRLRVLLNRILEESMSTVFNKISISPTPSPGARPSRTPSIVISPVTPSIPKHKVTFQEQLKPSTSAQRLKTYATVDKRLAGRSVPQLQKPERQLLAPALDHAMVAHMNQTAEGSVPDHGLQQALRMPSPIRPDKLLQLPTRQFVSPNAIGGSCTPARDVADLNIADLSNSFQSDESCAFEQYDEAAHVLDAGFEWHVPAHVTEDQGYDGECNSYEQGDDQHAMEEMIQMRCAGKPNNSTYSPVDSGYGSGNSLHPRFHAPKTSHDPDAFDGDSVTHDATFMQHMQHYQEYENLEQQQQQMNFSWPNHIGRAM